MIDASGMKVVKLRPADASGTFAEPVWMGIVKVDQSVLSKFKPSKPSRESKKET